MADDDSPDPGQPSDPGSPDPSSPSSPDPSSPDPSSPPPPPPPDASDSSPSPSDRSSAESDAASLPDPVGELRFQVVLQDATTIGAFAECSGLSVEYDIFEYQEGGEMRFVHKFRGALKYPNLVLKRGVTYEDALLKWFFDQDTDRESRGNVTLNLLGDDGQQVRTWSFAGAFPVKWSGPSFSAKSTNVATETLEIAHQGLLPPS